MEEYLRPSRLKQSPLLRAGVVQSFSISYCLSGSKSLSPLLNA